MIALSRKLSEVQTFVLINIALAGVTCLVFTSEVVSKKVIMLMASIDTTR